MKKIIKTFVVFCFLSSLVFAENEGEPKVDFSGISGQYETGSAEIKKIFSAVSSNGAKYKAYLVEWEGTEIIITDVLGKSKKKVGEKINYMVQEIEVNNSEASEKVLNFMLMEF